MSDLRTARELEADAAVALVPSPFASGPPRGEALSMLVRRGFSPSFSLLDVPFDPELPEAELARLAEALDRYAFRLFLRGAIQRRDGFSPEDATRFLTPDHARELAVLSESLGLLEGLPGGRFRLRRRATSFGGTLEWYVTRQIRVRYALDAVSGVEFHAPGIGGDLDVVAAAEGKLFVLELKSSPPKHLGEDEVGAFFERAWALKPDVSIFAVDTALRLSDKVIPLLVDTLARRGKEPRPRRIEHELWALTPHLYAVNAKPDLIANIGRALAEGLSALAPAPF